jgi:hypothetical protein
VTVTHLAASAYERHWRTFPEDIEGTVRLRVDCRSSPWNFYFIFCSAHWGSQTESRKDKIDDAILTLMMLFPMVENPAGFVDLAEGLHLGRAREDSAS